MEKERAEGIAQGATKSKIDIAKKLKEKGLTVEDIAEVTGLSRKEVEKL